MEPTNRRRVVRALEVTVGSGRPFSEFGPGLEAYPSSAVRQVGLARRTGRGRPAYRRARSPPWWRRVSSRRSRRWPPARPGSRARPARPSATARSSAHVEGGVPLADCVEEAVRRTRQFARRQASWFRRDPRVAWAHEHRPKPRTCSSRPSRCTAERRRLREWVDARHQARGRRERLLGRPRPRRRGPADSVPRSACWPTAAAGSGPTGSSASGPGATAATSSWSCTTRTVARPR